MTPSDIESATFRLLVQCLKQLRHTHIDYNVTVWNIMAYYRTLSSVFTGAAREY